MRREADAGELIGPPQLYKSFSMKNGVYAQVLDWIALFPETPDGDVLKIH